MLSWRNCYLAQCAYVRACVRSRVCVELGEVGKWSCEEAKVHETSMCMIYIACCCIISVFARQVRSDVRQDEARTQGDSRSQTP